MPNWADAVAYMSLTAAKIARITYRRLDYWRRTRLVVPSIRESTGSGDPCLWSLNDVVKMRLVAVLTEAGISLQRVRSLLDYLPQDPDADILLIDHGRVYACSGDDELLTLLRTAKGAVQYVRLDKIRSEVYERASTPVAA